MGEGAVGALDHLHFGLLALGDRQYAQFLCNPANNRVVSSTPLDEVRFAQVRTAFAKAFPQRAAATPVIPPCNKPDH